MVIPPEEPCSPRSRPKIRFEVCRCFLGRPSSSSRIRSMIPVNGSSFGRAGGRLRRYRKRQHLRNRQRVDAKTPRRCPPAHTFNVNRITNLSIELHALHPPAPAAVRQRPSAAGFLLRRNRTARPLHGGSFLRRLQDHITYFESLPKNASEITFSI